MEEFDAIIIGAGQAGPFLGARLAEAGRRVALIEREHLGGTCVNDGCTPTKTMVAPPRLRCSRCLSWGVAISLWPMIVPGHFTLWEAASPESTQAFLLVGTLVLLPVILFYTGWPYWVFRGKVQQGEGH